MFFALLQMILGERDGFMSPQSTRHQQGKQRSVAFAPEALVVRGSPERLRLFRRQPVPQPYAQLFHSFHAADTRCQVGAKKATVGCFVGETAHSTEAKIDCAWSELSRFQMRAIAQDYRPVQG